MHHLTAIRFDDWRVAARRLLAGGVEPPEVLWNDGRSSQPDLFADTTDELAQLTPAKAQAAQVNKKFIELAEWVAAHRSADRWPLLYRLLWRITHESPRLLDLAVDDDVHHATLMAKAVHRDRHKMRAFVRFNRRMVDGSEQYFAWYEPDHHTLELNIPFFRDRFSSMQWTIFTPDESAAWDGHEIRFGPGTERSLAPRGDELESLWRTYYGNIFNPARIKIAAMKREMPVRFWKNLPETTVIDELLAAAPTRVEAMTRHTEGHKITAADFVPPTHSLQTLADAAQKCEGCPLYADATQVVFGEGKKSAAIMLIGEQPGDEEDRQGRPFVGPAGRILDEALKDAGVDRDSVYVTNSVKHFSFELRGKRRLHKTPRRLDVVACRPWLEAELAAVEPEVVVCLGATAAQSLAGPTTRLKNVMGTTVETEYSKQTIATYHPSAILRSRDDADAEEKRRQLVADLRRAAKLVAG